MHAAFGPDPNCRYELNDLRLEGLGNTRNHAAQFWAIIDKGGLEPDRHLMYRYADSIPRLKGKLRQFIANELPHNRDPPLTQLARLMERSHALMAAENDQLQYGGGTRDRSPPPTKPGKAFHSEGRASNPDLEELKSLVKDGLTQLGKRLDKVETAVSSRAPSQWESGRSAGGRGAGRHTSFATQPDAACGTAGAPPRKTQEPEAPPRTGDAAIVAAIQSGFASLQGTIEGSQTTLLTQMSNLSASMQEVVIATRPQSQWQGQRQGQSQWQGQRHGQGQGRGSGGAPSHQQGGRGLPYGPGPGGKPAPLPFSQGLLHALAAPRPAAWPPGLRLARRAAWRRVL
jgi:hypothetical protein